MKLLDDFPMWALLLAFVLPLVFAAWQSVTPKRKPMERAVEAEHSADDAEHPALAEARATLARIDTAPLSIDPLQELHNVLCTAQRTNGITQADAIARARLLLSRYREAQRINVATGAPHEH